MKSKATLIAKGGLQRVGYRDTVERIARKANLKGYVKNLKPYDVKIVVEGEKDKIDSFIKQIRIKKFPIFVEDLEVKFGKATGKFKYFEIKRGNWQEELGERMDFAGQLLYKSVELGERSVELGERSVELSEKSVELSEKSVSIGEKMLGKQDQMLGKQDQMLEKQDQMLEKQDQMLEKQDDTIREIRGVGDQMLEKQDDTIREIRGVRYDLKTYMERRFGEIEVEISKIKSHIGLS